MSIDKVIEIYGKVKMNFYAYYKYTFYYRAKVDDISIELALDLGDDCYKHSVNIDSPNNLETYFYGILSIRDKNNEVIFSGDLNARK